LAPKFLCVGRHDVLIRNTTYVHYGKKERLFSYGGCLMYLIPMAWIYVALMMAIAEATNTNGTVLGGIMTFVLYGLLPVGLVVYLMGSSSRRKAIKAKEAEELAAYRATQVSAAQASATQTTEAQASIHPDASSHAPADAVAPVRKEP